MRRGSNRSGAIYKISSTTGLIGSVSLTELGADFDIKLNPNVRIGDRVQVESQVGSVNFGAIYYRKVPASLGSGTYVVKSLKRKGSYYAPGEAWSTSIVGWREGETGLLPAGGLNV